MVFFENMVGRKIVMAVSGLVMVLFVVAHLLGNTTIFSGPNGINAYAEKLHELFPLVWTYRLVMIVLVFLHIVFGIQLTVENYRAKPDSYAVRKSLSATFAGRSMIWTGIIVGGFIVYHLLQFTFQVTNPAVSAAENLDTMGRPDVFHMVVYTFRRAVMSMIYIGALIALALHLIHGIQSSFQTLGLNNDRTFPVIIRSAAFAAAIIFLGYVSIPIMIFTGILKG